MKLNSCNFAHSCIVICGFFDRHSCFPKIILMTQGTILKTSIKFDTKQITPNQFRKIRLRLPNGLSADENRTGILTLSWYNTLV